MYVFVTKKLREENILSVPSCGKISRPRWIVPGSCPQCHIFSLFLIHEPYQCPRHHRSDPGQQYQSICQSSGHSGGTVFGLTLARHVLVSALSVRDSPQVCYSRSVTAKILVTAIQTHGEMIFGYPGNETKSRGGQTCYMGGGA